MKMSEVVVDKYFYNMIDLCNSIEESRKARGIRFCVGIIIFCVFLSECAQRCSQRAKIIWISSNWDIITELWNVHSPQKCRNENAFSQSCLSRFFKCLNYLEILDKFTSYSKDDFSNEWEKVKEARKKGLSLSHNNSNTDKRCRSKVCQGDVPHYAIDGKARKGVMSEATGRTEIDITIFNTDTQKVLAQKTLPDKEGEAVAAEELIKTHGQSLPEGIFTADAGITSPRVTEAIRSNNQHYLLSIKANSGKVYDQIKSFDWKSIATSHVQISEGHGRQEIRKLKKISLSTIGKDDYKKYKDAKVAYYLETKVNHIKEDKLTIEDRYFIGDEFLSEVSLPKVSTYIRSHWQQESYHWVKDVILKEDDSFQKTKNGSRFLSVLRSQVFMVGKKLCGSVKEFTERFVAKPQNFIANGDKK